ncbi:MAG: ABC transporter ATP-binding protein [Candidatus Omnitrophica bacterium]|nr:ABC transporter ATP-binding protein [Candidatus Omnitrophota bacterium]
MIEVKGLTKRFNGGQYVLNHLDLLIKDGEILVILGESGTGKSVLLRHLIGLIRPDQGKVIINDVDITKLSEKELLKLRSNIGYLFQEGALYDSMTVFENLAFPLQEHSQLTEPEIEKKIKAVLDMVDLVAVENQYPSQLSGGMKKRVGLARSIILDSKILFCDEPTSGLDPIRSHDISDLIASISRKMKCTTVITSHDVRNSFRIADRVAILKDGKLKALGTPAELKKSEDPFVQEFLS